MPRYQLSIHAQKLPTRLFRGRPNPYAVVTVSGGPHEGLVIGRTETMQKEVTPDFIKVLFVETEASVYMPIVVSLMDERRYDTDVLLAEANFEVTEIFKAKGNSQSQVTSKGAK
jgi:Ca2+-dependent lipid-binding protein